MIQNQEQVVSICLQEAWAFARVEQKVTGEVLKVFLWLPFEVGPV